MKRLVLGLVLAWLATGIYIVPANERAVVRRCGRAVRDATGAVALRASGLYYDWPWPFSQVDRVNVQEVRTLLVGPSFERAEPADVFLPAEEVRPAQYLTGDKNVLDVQLAVQYRVSAEHAADYLFRQTDAERRLRWQVETTATDLLARSGVDYVHPLGLAALRERLTAAVRRTAEEQRLGLVVEDVTLTDVAPPLPVKSYFLDVVNARADRERAIEDARGYAERRREQARGEAQTLRNAALQFRDRTLEAARARASRFEQLLAATDSGSRLMTLRRLYWETLTDVLQNLRGQVFLDTGQPIDLTIWPERE